jgi:hypothetical protein
MTRNEFMEVWRSDEIDMLSADDRIEIFLGALNGQSDLTRKLLVELCDGYDISLTDVLNR